MICCIAKLDIAMHKTVIFTVFCAETLDNKSENIFVVYNNK